MNDYQNLIETAIDGAISEQELLQYIIENGADEELLTKLGYNNARISKNIKTAGIIDFIKRKCKNNKALLTGVISLLIISGSLHHYKAYKGEEFKNIAQRTKCSVQELQYLNPHIDSDIIETETDIIVPEEIKQDNYYYLQPGDTLSHIAAYLKISVNELLKMNPQIKDVKKLQIGEPINIGQHDVPKSVRKKSVKQKTHVKKDYSNGTPLNMNAVIKALKQVETSGGINNKPGDKGKAIGVFQLWEIFVKQYHRLGGNPNYQCHVVNGVAQADDVRWDEKKSEEIVRFVLKKHGYKTMKEIIKGTAKLPAWNKGVSNEKLQEYIDAYNYFNNR